MVVAGLLTGGPNSPPGRILDGMLAARFPFLLSLELLSEYRTVLLRKPIQRRHQLGAQEVEVILTEIAANAIFREPEETEPAGAPKADPGDRHLICMLATHPTASLVTGDHNLQRALQEFCSVYSPVEFVGLMHL